MGPKKKLIDKSVSPLHLIERFAYFLATLCTIFYMCYSVYKDSIKYDGILNLYDFDKGWCWLNREQDISNFEWRFWYTMFWRVWPWYIGHIAVGRIALLNHPAARKYIFLLYSFATVSYLVGWRPVVLFLIHCTVLHVTSVSGSTIAVWIVSLLSLSTLNFEPFISLMKGIVEEDPEETWYYLLMFTLALLNIKSTSFCVEKCWYKWRKSKISYPVSVGEESMYNEIELDERIKDGSNDTATDDADDDDDADGVFGYSFVDLLAYVFYIPLYFTGPLLTYNLFRRQMNQTISDEMKPRTRTLVLHVVRFCFWAAFNEFILHFLYFNALQHNHTALRSVSLFTLAGIGYLHGQFFMIKYLVMFGLPGTIAKFDYLEPPDGPKCISYIYLYSDMWKYFDRGLYSFLKRYIYVPCGGSQTGFHRQIIASMLCFMYIFYWHGAMQFILWWILLNYAGVSFEKIGSVLCNLSIVKRLETDVLSASMVQRIHAFFSIPIFLVSCFSMFCFFGGESVGYIFYQRLILQGTLSSFAVLTFLVYCAIQNGKEVNRWIQKQEKVKQS